MNLEDFPFEICTGTPKARDLVKKVVPYCISNDYNCDDIAEVLQMCNKLGTLDCSCAFGVYLSFGMLFFVQSMMVLALGLSLMK